MNITRHVTDIKGFTEAYEDVYESIRQLQQNTENKPFILMRAQNVVDAFERRYNVVLLKEYDEVSMVFSFDTVNFKTEENLTMCLLKWL